MSRQIQVHIQIERELGYGELNAYSGSVITDGPLDIYVRGSNPENVRNMLQTEVLQHAAQGKISLEFPPRTWTEVLNVTLPDEIAENVDYNG